MDNKLSKEACEAAAEKLKHDANDIYGAAAPDSEYHQLAAHCCRIVGAGLDGFESFVKSLSREERVRLDRADTASGWAHSETAERHSYFVAGYAAATVALEKRIAELQASRDRWQADARVLAAEVRRLGDLGHGMSPLTEAAVREALARVEGE